MGNSVAFGLKRATVPHQKSETVGKVHSSSDSCIAYFKIYEDVRVRANRSRQVADGGKRGLVVPNVSFLLETQSRHWPVRRESQDSGIGTSNVLRVTDTMQ
jgi:hypothetical protein